ncbi:MAG TPA: hypothetical protein VL053_03055 [Arachidicoccus sp.]|nr:hypothetical protein [Arachidicoccus sp.]
MENVHYPSANPQPPSPSPEQNPRDKNRKIIYGVLIALLLATWAYIIYDHSHKNQEIAGLQFQTSSSDSARSAIQTEYNDALKRMDSLTGSNTQLQGAMAQQKQEIDELKKRIETIRDQNNGDLSKAKSLIEELKGKVNGLFEQLAVLKKENADLTVSNQTLTSERDTIAAQKKIVADSLNSVSIAKNKILDEASTLHASNISIEALKLKGDKETTTTRAKKADLLRVNFTIDANRVAPSGPKDLYIIVVAPDGRVVSIPSQGSGTFQTREEGQKVYTNMQNISYQQGQKQNVSFDWDQGGRYQTGEYKIEIYNNGYKIGEGVKTLKKTGFLGL